MKYIFYNKKNIKKNQGFLLIEMLVAVFIFSIVMFISLGAVLTLVDVNRKNQSTKSVINNLTLVVNGMVKNIAVSTGYYCGIAPTSGGGAYNGTGKDCTNINDALGSITFTSNEDSNNNGVPDVYRYKFDANNPDGTGRILRSIDSNANASYTSITAPEVKITGMYFLVFNTAPLVVDISDGTTLGDIKQPYVVLLITGYAGKKQNTESSFTIQTTVSQRTLDVKYQP